MKRSIKWMMTVFAMVCIAIPTFGINPRIKSQELKPVHPSYALDLSKQRKPDLTYKPGWGGVDPVGNSIKVNSQYIELNGQPWLMVAGEMHPTRYPASGWEEQIMKMKAGGLNTISVYIFWNNHEEEEGVFNWTDNRDIRHYIELCKKHDMKVFLRVGPFCNGECVNGGLPQFLKDKGVKFRTNDLVYFDYVRKLYQQIGQQVQGLMFKDGGPIMAVQLENEFEHAPTSWGFVGVGGQEHMLTLKRLAIEAGLVAPMYVCTAWGSPVPPNEMIPGQGGYVFMNTGPPTSYYLFKDMHNIKHGNYDATQYPIANIEIGPGFFPHDQWRPTIPPESSEALAMMMTASGGNIQGYYMYQGGSQFIGKKGSTGSFPFLNYDFQGPLREFGQTNAIYRYLKPVNFFLDDFGDLLAPMATAIPANPVSDPRNVNDLRYAARAHGKSGFLFLNNYQDRVQMPDKNNLSFELKFSDSILRIPLEGGFNLKQNQCAILPFNLDLEGTHLDYALAQLFTRTKTDDGRNVYVFFVPDGMNGQYVFDRKTIESVKAKSATLVESNGRTIVAVKPGTDCLMQVRSKSGKEFEILTLTRQQALGLTRQDIFGQRRLVLSDNDVVCSGGKLRISQIGSTKLNFAVFPAPKESLVAEMGIMVNSRDGVFRRYSIRVPEVKPDVTIEGIGSSEVKIRSTASVLDGVNDVFLRVSYLGNEGTLKHDGIPLCDNLFNRTPWEIGLKRFRNKLTSDPLVLSVSPPKPIIEVINNEEVNSGVTDLEAPKGELLVSNYEKSSAPPTNGTEKGYVALVTVHPEYAVWIHTRVSAP